MSLEHLGPVVVVLSENLFEARFLAAYREFHLVRFLVWLHRDNADNQLARLGKVVILMGSVCPELALLNRKVVGVEQGCLAVLGRRHGRGRDRAEKLFGLFCVHAFYIFFFYFQSRK